MHIGVPLETHAGETRVAATPETIKKLIGQGHQVTVQAGAGGGFGDGELVVGPAPSEPGPGDPVGPGEQDGAPAARRAAVRQEIPSPTSTPTAVG